MIDRQILQRIQELLPDVSDHDVTAMAHLFRAALQLLLEQDHLQQCAKRPSRHL